MSPKKQQHATVRVSGNGTNKPTAGGGTKAPAVGGSRPGNGMNFFAALSGIADADALHDELKTEEEQRRQPSSKGAAAPADGRRSRNGDQGRMKQPLVWIGEWVWRPHVCTLACAEQVFLFVSQTLR